MTKIAFIGAGSTVFAKNLMGDLLHFPEFKDATFALMDIDGERLRTSEIVARRLAAQLDAAPTIEATLDQRAALAGADFVITMFQVGGYRPSTVIDFEIPRKYGLQQTIGDTLGIGGIMRGLRTVPVLLDLCRNMEALCPNALLLQYVNPMAINCWSIARASSIQTVGLCHSVQGTAEQLASDLDVPAAELSYLCAGINHMAFYLKFARRNGHGEEDLYPLLHERAANGAPSRFMIARSDGAGWPLSDAVRYEMFRRLGYFVTESSEHFSEYVPYFIKREQPELLEEFEIPINEYIRRCENNIAHWEAERIKLEDPNALLTVRRSHEYGADIVHSATTGTPSVIYGNVPNRGLIDNLPEGCCVEVPCLVDGNGIQPTHIGALPPHLAALMQTNINVQSLVVEAALTHKREHIYHAAMLDPHTAAELTLDQIWAMVDELIEAHGDYLPEYA